MIANREVIDEVCRRFGLGTVRVAPVSVAGGLSNRLYRLVTERGEFAVKRMVANADAPEFKRNVEAAFVVEQRARAAGIPMPEPVLVMGSNEALGRIETGGDRCWVRAHRWVEASPVDPGDLQPGDLAAVGAILAALHGLPIEDEATAPNATRSLPDRDWPTALAGQFTTTSLARAVLVLEEVVRREWTEPPSRPVLAHRDLDAKNLLRARGGRLTLLDWDAAGPADAQWDAVGVALDWSGIWQGAVSPAAFAEVLDAYVAQGGRLDPVTAGSFAGWAEGMLGWLWFNLERAGSPNVRERSLGLAEVIVMTQLLPAAAGWISRFR